jgi:hypothetical protein
VLFDLALADFLLSQGWSKAVAFHLKERPFFISDAMVKDVHDSIHSLLNSAERTLRQLGKRISAHLAAGQLVLTDDRELGSPYWTSSLMFRRMPEPLRRALSQSDLIVLKGDVNYRRLLDDRHWPYTARLAEAAGYFPASLLAMRTLKGELLVGLRPGQAEALAQADERWLTNGKRGVIHLRARGWQPQ